MDCKKAEEMMSLFIDQELLPDEERQFLDHVASCPSCSKMLTELKSVVSLLKQMPKEIEVPVDLTETVKNQLKTLSLSKRRKTLRQNLLRYGSIAAVFVLCLGAMTLFMGRPSTDESLPENQNQALLRSTGDGVSKDQLTMEDKGSAVITGTLPASKEEELEENEFSISGGQSTDAENHLLNPAQMDEPSGYDGLTPNVIQYSGDNPNSKIASAVIHRELTLSITVIDSVKAILTEDITDITESITSKDEPYLTFYMTEGKYERLKERLTDELLTYTEEILEEPEDENYHIRILFQPE